MFSNKSKSYAFVPVGDVAEVGGLSMLDTQQFLKEEVMDDDNHSVVSTGWIPGYCCVTVMPENLYFSVSVICSWQMI